MSFENWYIEFRYEMSKIYNISYSIYSLANIDNFKHYYDEKLTPKQAVLEYSKKKSNV